MVNLKHYLILMIGFFLALGVGILIGITLSSKNVLEKQQEIIIRRIEEDLSRIRSKNEQLNNEIFHLQTEKGKTDYLCELLFPEIIKNRLSGLKISIIKTTDKFNYAELFNLFNLSGALVESNVTLQINSLINEKEYGNALEVVKQQVEQQENLYQLIAEDLVFSVYHGTSTILIDQLKQFNLLSGLLVNNKGCDVIILAGGGYEKDKNSNNIFLDIEIIREALKNGISIIALETEQILKTAVPQYKKLGISTIDNVDTIYGKLALVSVLEGNWGHFGEKEGANALIPEPLFPISSLESKIIEEDGIQ